MWTFVPKHYFPMLVDRLYWCDSGTGNIELARPDGSDRRLVRWIDPARNHISGVAVVDQYIYFTSWNARFVGLSVYVVY